jgi:hypothetical protein
VVASFARISLFAIFTKALLSFQEYNEKLIKHQQEKEELTIKAQTQTQSNPISE